MVLFKNRIQSLMLLFFVLTSYAANKPTDDLRLVSGNYLNVQEGIFNSSFTRQDTIDYGKNRLVETTIFHHSSFADFIGGTLSNSGQNLFVSRDGEIRFNNWFDLNNDGHPEIVVVNDHDHYSTVDGFIYYNSPTKGFRSLLPPAEEFVPSFQKIKWIEESQKSMDKLPSLGGGRTLVEDLNRDGYPEILFTNFVHGWAANHFPVFVYWGSSEGYSSSRVSHFPSLSASGLAVADLSGNGYKDLIMANIGREYVAQSQAGTTYFNGEELVRDEVGPEEGTSYIYWQKVYGYSEDERSELPTEYALDVAVADLNRNENDDIVFLQGGNPGSVRIFYSDSTGVNIQKYVDIKSLRPAYGAVERKFLVSDLNNDGWIDIFVPSVGDRSEIFWNSPQGFSDEQVSYIESNDAIAAEAKDLNRNGFVDLVIANNRGPSYVYWGKRSGFSVQNRTELPTNAATGVKIADFNDDGFYDIIFSNRLEGDDFDNSSFIYWGSENGYHEADRQNLFGFGPVDVNIGDFDGNGTTDIFLMNRQSGRSAPQFGGESYAPTDLFVFWGNPRNKYSEAVMSTLPGVSAQADVSAGDFNGNGHADLVYTTHSGRILNIFYGELSGYSKKRNMKIDLPFNGRSTLTADLNYDGYLDIIVGSLSSDKIAVILGKQDDFEEPFILDFGIKHTRAALGDVNGNGYLDLILGGDGYIKILHGTVDGLFDENQTEFIDTEMRTSRVSVADLNDDGFLDIFAHHFSLAGKMWKNNVFSAIYWNTRGSFSAGNRLEIPSHGAVGGSISDVNNDGYLDILIANYNSQISRNLDTVVYFGGADNTYSENNRFNLPSFSSAANMALDLDGNGIKDIVVFNHQVSTQYTGLNSVGGVHGAGSFIYWGTENGWNIKNRDHLPSMGPHSRLVAEPGDIISRRTYEEYSSSIIELETTLNKFKLNVESSLNSRQDIQAFIRVANNTDNLANAVWQEVRLKIRGKEYLVFEGSLNQDNRFLQYKLRLDTGDTGTGPTVKSVRMYHQSKE